MQFFQFSQHLDQLEQTSSRLEMTAQLAELFSQLEPAEIPIACYLMQGRLVPIYQSLEFNMSEKLTMRAMAKLLSTLNQDSNVPTINLFDQQDDSLYQQKIQKKYKKVGDLGLTIEQLLDQVDINSANLSLTQVYDYLVAIAQEGGTGSQDRKINQVYELLAQLQPLSMRFVARIIIGKLRLGFSTMTMIDALSWAKTGDKTESKKIEQAYQKKVDIGRLARGYLAAPTTAKRKEFLDSFAVEVGIPVLPALCQRINTAEEIIKKMKQVLVEPKYDGLRTQIHIDKRNQQQPYQVFTRNLDDVTHMFPELATVLNTIKADSCILDAEAVGYDAKSGKLSSFQETITRRRKHAVNEQSAKVPIRFFVFDVLAKNGQSLIQQPLIERKQVLATLFDNNDTLQITKFVITSDPQELHQYHVTQLRAGLEGAVIKQVDSLYKAGRKGYRWVKIKEAEGTQGRLSDTLDCVVMGYYRGKGKRASFGIGAFLVGVVDQKNQVKTIAKIGTGLTDAEFKQIKLLADSQVSAQQPKPYDVPKTLLPDVWVAPSLVVEIAADELTTSPLHTAQQALRFPRLVKIRTDKSWEQATKLEELAEIRVA